MKLVRNCSSPKLKSRSPVSRTCAVRLNSDSTFLTLFIHVAVPVPNLDLLTYAVPDGVAAPGGRRARRRAARLAGRDRDRRRRRAATPTRPDVPRRRRRSNRSAKCSTPSAFVPPEVVALARWTAEYYAAGVGDAIPARAAAEGARRARRRAQDAARGGDHRGGAGSARRDRSASRRSNRKRWHFLPARRQELPRRRSPAAGSQPMRSPASPRRGYVSLRHDTRRPRPVRSDRGRTPIRPGAAVGGRTGVRPRLTAAQLTGEQAAALERLIALAAAGEFRVALLHGVTGSGKTEIYIRLVGRGSRGRPARADARAGDRADARRRRRSSAQAFGERVAIQHSGLSDGERHDQWQRIRRGEVDVVVGTRSAVFAPLEQVGLIVVDEEHDASYKQEESPRYNGRDVAIVRGAARGRARRPRLGDAVDGELSQRDRPASTSGSCSSGACSTGRSRR